MKTFEEIKQHIVDMHLDKRAKLESAAMREGMTLIEYLTDLYEWGDIQSGNTIIIKSSTAGNITQNDKKGNVDNV